MSTTVALEMKEDFLLLTGEELQIVEYMKTNLA
jgi:hypothetical protein